MKIMIVEDDKIKRFFLEEFLRLEGVEFCVFGSINPAIKYAINHRNEINGIILDMGLPSSDTSDDHDPKKGMRLIGELTKKRINIPILINSSTSIELSGIMIRHKNVVGQMIFEDDHHKIKWFIKLLNGEEQ